MEIETVVDPAPLWVPDTTSTFILLRRSVCSFVQLWVGTFVYCGLSVWTMWLDGDDGVDKNRK